MRREEEVPVSFLFTHSYFLNLPCVLIVCALLKFSNTDSIDRKIFICRSANIIDRRDRSNSNGIQA